MTENGKNGSDTDSGMRSNIVSGALPDDTYDQFQEYKRTHDQTQSEALRDLIRTGLLNWELSQEMETPRGIAKDAVIFAVLATIPVIAVYFGGILAGIAVITLAAAWPLLERVHDRIRGHR